MYNAEKGKSVVEYRPSQLYPLLTEYYLLQGRLRSAVPLLLGPPGVGKSTVSEDSFVQLSNALVRLAVERGVSFDTLERRAREIAEKCSRDDICSSVYQEILRIYDTEEGKRAIEPILKKVPKALKTAEAVKEIYGKDLVRGASVFYDNSIEKKLYEDSFVIVNLTVSIHEPPDLLGVPVINDGVMDYASPGWAKALRDSLLGVLILDEFTNVMNDMLKNAMYSLVLERRSGFIRFNKPIVATGNMSQHSELVDTLPAPLIMGRMALIEVASPTLKEWTEYMNRKYGERWYKPLAPILDMFHSITGDVFIAKEERMRNAYSVVPGETKPYPTPRAWECVATHLYVLSKMKLDPEEKRERAKNLVISLVGDENYMIEEVIAEALVPTGISEEEIERLQEAIERWDLEVLKETIHESREALSPSRIEEIIRKLNEVFTQERKPGEELLRSAKKAFSDLYTSVVKLSYIISRVKERWDGTCDERARLLRECMEVIPIPDEDIVQDDDDYKKVIVNALVNTFNIMVGDEVRELKEKLDEKCGTE
ncbi:hypothetical protein IPA_06615 [Ignicoccus pacificus DSM 13166]|uniref:Uncharacterized protein n=1 Tax=Ignicoccus pacificus DSM 13166 TaxID=940294 RepID=A0A977KBJ5_9CREN|nr:hypothetical protein IPA_06615 [Ignicoccus pacificus DSM 13166]